MQKAATPRESIAAPHAYLLLYVWVLRGLSKDCVVFTWVLKGTTLESMQMAATGCTSS